MKYDTAKLRQFIQEFFSADELTIFLVDNFTTVSNDVTPVMPKSQQVQRLLDYCVRHNKMSDLLAVLHRERPNTFSPDEYVQGQNTPAASPATLGTLLNNYRTQANDPVTGGSLTQSRLAEERFNHSSVMIGKWERDRTTISIDNRLTLIGLIRALYKSDGIRKVDEARSLVSAAGHQDLNQEEIQSIFGNLP